jgi:hypothetical protein
LKRRIVWWIAAALLGCLGLGGWWLASIVWKPTGQFLPQASDSRVLYEPGAEEMAAEVAEALPAAIDAVEGGHYRRFAEPVRVYVCASKESFRSYSLRIGDAAGFVFNQRLFLSPKLASTPQRIPRILAHELSHLHLEQQIGSLRAGGELPEWFKEGLAVYVSGGGGAENVGEEEARQAIASGRHLEPKTSGSLLFPTDATEYGMTHHMFYRQSSLFIGYLKQLNAAQFKTFLLAIEDKRPLERAFEDAYGRSLEAAWREFVVEVRAAVK